jgi:hypothetical protein
MLQDGVQVEKHPLPHRFFDLAIWVLRLCKNTHEPRHVKGEGTRKKKGSTLLCNPHSIRMGRPKEYFRLDNRKLTIEHHGTRRPHTFHYPSSARDPFVVLAQGLSAEVC